MWFHIKRSGYYTADSYGYGDWCVERRTSSVLPPNWEPVVFVNSGRFSIDRDYVSIGGVTCQQSG